MILLGSIAHFEVRLPLLPLFFFRDPMRSKQPKSRPLESTTYDSQIS